MVVPGFPLLKGLPGPSSTVAKEQRRLCNGPLLRHLRGPSDTRGFLQCLCPGRHQLGRPGGRQLPRWVDPRKPSRWHRVQQLHKIHRQAGACHERKPQTSRCPCRSCVDWAHGQYRGAPGRRLLRLVPGHVDELVRLIRHRGAPALEQLEVVEG